MADSSLTPLQKRFSEEYVIDLNASAAYQRAGYKCKDSDIARAAASRLLANVNVASYVQELRSRRSLSTGITAERVLKELGRLAFSDIRSVMEFSGSGITLKHSQELDDDAAAAIAEVSENKTEGGSTTKVKFHNKVQALKLLAQHTGLLGDLNIARSILRTYGLEVEISEFGAPIKVVSLDEQNDPTNEESEHENILSEVESDDDATEET
ncbi:MAG: terminase small subunit [Leptolyngbyaceae cyanobacterium CSU_1_4]|nr:terminase small subunit [Leptolyngbyaceae cyanobacterium CSU_1_4]